jgi:hypothetical protein
MRDNCLAYELRFASGIAIILQEGYTFFLLSNIVCHASTDCYKGNKHIKPVAATITKIASVVVVESILYLI